MKSPGELKSRPDSETAETQKYNNEKNLGGPCELRESENGRRGLMYKGVTPFGAAYIFNANYRSGPSDLTCVSFNYPHAKE